MVDKNPRHTIQVSHESLGELQQQCQKFEQSITKLGIRDKELFGMIGDALRRKDSLRANMYANELVRVRHLKQVFSQSQLVMECITIRMESLLDLYTAIQIDPVSEAIKDVIGDIKGLSPEFMMGIEQIAVTARETLKQATIGIKEPALEEVFTANSPESVAILREVSASIESSLHQAFPEPPIKADAATMVETVEEITYGYEPTSSSVKAPSQNQNSDINTLSDDLNWLLHDLDAKKNTQDNSRP